MNVLQAPPTQGCCQHPGGGGAVPCHWLGSRWGCACNPPKSCCGLSGLAAEGCKECGAMYGPRSLYASAFLWDQLPTMSPSRCKEPWGRPAGTQATVEVLARLVEVRSAQRCRPPASREFSMSPESQQGNSNYVQGTRVQNKPKSPAGCRSLAKMRQCKN